MKNKAVNAPIKFEEIVMVMNDSLIITKTKFSNLVGHQLHALNRTVRVITRAFKWLLFTASKKNDLGISCVLV